jgi:MFS family permease
MMGASGSSSERGVLGPRALDPVVPNLLFSVTQIVLHVCLPQLLLQLVCKEMGLTGLECDSAAVSGQASIVSLYSSVLIAVPGLFIVGFYGKFADYYGLKMTLLCPVVGNFLFLACMCWALLHPEHYFPILMLGSVISGFRCGLRRADAL